MASTLHTWQFIPGQADRFEVPGGWIYRFNEVQEHFVYVPAPPRSLLSELSVSSILTLAWDLAVTDEQKGLVERLDRKLNGR